MQALGDDIHNLRTDIADVVVQQADALILLVALHSGNHRIEPVQTLRDVGAEVGGHDGGAAECDERRGEAGEVRRIDAVEEAGEEGTLALGLEPLGAC